MIKTIIADNAQDFDDQVNMWESSHNVFATQTHVSRDPGMVTQYTAVIFYRGKADYNKS